MGTEDAISPINWNKSENFCSFSLQTGVTSPAEVCKHLEGAYGLTRAPSLATDLESWGSQLFKGEGKLQVSLFVCVIYFCVCDFMVLFLPLFIQRFDIKAEDPSSCCLDLDERSVIALLRSNGSALE